MTSQRLLLGILLIGTIMTITVESFVGITKPIQSTTLMASVRYTNNNDDNTYPSIQNPKQQQNKQQHDFSRTCVTIACSIVFQLATSSVSYPLLAYADGQTESFKFPPIDYTDKERCVLSSSSMGQANAARDKLYDLRQCKLSNVNAAGYDLSGVIMTETDASNANFREAYFSKGFLRDSKFDGADFTNAIVDRASFKGSSLKGAIFANTVLTGTSFDGANVENADFTEAAIGVFDLRNLCKNPTLQGVNPTTGEDTRTSAGCK